MFLWDVMAGTTIRRIAGHMGKIFVVDFNADASVVASGTFFLSIDQRAASTDPIAPHRLIRLYCTTLGFEIAKSTSHPGFGRSS